MKKEEGAVIVPKSVFPKPSAKELSAAYILLDYFKTDITFVPRSNQKTPDFLISNKYYELKTPIGNGKYNLQHLLKSAIQQSENIIVDARYSKMHISRIIRELKHHSTKTTKGVKSLLIITKSKTVIVIV